MSETPSSGDDSYLDLIRYTFDPEKNAREMLRNLKSAPDDIHWTWAKYFLCIHGTTPELLRSIVEDDTVFSYAELEKIHPEVTQNRKERATDSLDIELGLHRYSFWNVGRVHPADVQDLYLCAPNSLIQSEGALVAPREITHFGALVSPESIAVRRESQPNLDVMKRNQSAVQQFFKTVVKGKDFRNIFGRFLQHHYPREYAHYLSAMFYPGEKPKIERIAGKQAIMNAWEGPQLKIPGAVPLSKVQSVLVTSLDPAVMERVQRSGFPPERIFSMKDALSAYAKFYGNTLGDYNDPTRKHGYIHLALRDLALIASHNEDHTSYPESMVAFKDRISK